MRPMGRKVQKHNCKWKCKENGKNIPAWWDDLIEPSSKRERSEIKHMLKNIGGGTSNKRPKNDGRESTEGF